MVKLADETAQLRPTVALLKNIKKDILPLNVFLTSAILLLAYASVSQAAAPTFCIVPVDSSLLNRQDDPTPLGSGKQWEVGEQVFDIPRLPSPIIELFYSYSYRYWIDKDLKMVGYNQPYPAFGYANMWVEEPWSSRIIGTNYNISIMPANDSQFNILIKAPNPNFFSQLEVLPEKKETVALRADGQPFLIGPTDVTPWLSKNDMAQHGIRGIVYLHSSPYLGGTVIVDIDLKLHLLKDDGQWVDLGQLDRSVGQGGLVYPVGFHDLPAAGILIVSQTGEGEHDLVITVQKSPSEPNSFLIQKLAPPVWFFDQGIYRVSKTFSQLLKFGRKNIFTLRPVWELLTPNGFVNIPGGDTDPESFSDGFPNPSPGNLEDLPSIHLDLIYGGDGLFLYNGKEIVRVSHSSKAELGDFAWVTDVPAIHKDLVVTSMGIFNLSANATVTKVELPFKFDGTRTGIIISNWQEAGVALAITSVGVFTIDENLVVRPVTSNYDVNYVWDTAINTLGTISAPTRAEIVQFNDKFWAIIDTQLAGASACPIQ